MSLDQGIVDDLVEDYSRSELVVMRRTLAKALMDPESVTQQETEALAFRVDPRSPNQLRAQLALIRAAIVQHDSPTPAIADADSMSTGFDFSTRRLE